MWCIRRAATTAKWEVLSCAGGDRGASSDDVAGLKKRKGIEGPAKYLSSGMVADIVGLQEDAVVLVYDVNHLTALKWRKRGGL